MLKLASSSFTVLQRLLIMSLSAIAIVPRVNAATDTPALDNKTVIRVVPSASQDMPDSPDVSRLSSHLPIGFDTRPIVVLREDDIRSTWRTPFPDFGGLSAFEYGKLKRIPVTWGIITSLADTGVQLTWDELRGYLDAAGGEPASHSVTHQPQQTDDAYIEELIDSKSAIDAHLGPQYICRSFLQPGSWTGDNYMWLFDQLYNRVGLAIQATYANSMAYLGSGWQIGNTYYRYGMMPIYSLDYIDGPTVESVIATLDVVANCPGLVFVATCHGIQSNTGTEDRCVRAAVMKAFMDKAAELRDAGRVRLMGLSDAFEALFPEDINRIPDGGFEAVQPGPLNPHGPWKLSGGAYIESNSGVGGTRCVALPSNNSKAESYSLILPPGRYVLSWQQIRQQGEPSNAAVRVAVFNYANPSSSTGRNPIAYAYFYSSAAGVYEQKTALLQIADRLPMSIFTFLVANGNGSGGFRIDDVVLTSAPLDPSKAPTSISITPTPSGGKISWMCPTDTAVNSISCRYDTRTHPLTPSYGILLGTAPAQHGTRQEMTFSLNWDSLSPRSAYFSVFGNRANGASDPGIAYVVVDSTPPTTSSLVVTPVSDGQVNAHWVSSDPQSSIYSSRYAVGTSPGSDDILPWTDIQDDQVTITNLPTDKDLFFAVKSQNVFGYWSPTVSKQFNCALHDPRDVVNLPDGSSVLVSGIVTAVFEDGCYIESQDRCRGIKLVGIVNPVEEQQITVGGTITTVSGERIVVVSNP